MSKMLLRLVSAELQRRFAESISYINNISGTHAEQRFLNVARVEARPDLPILVAGSLICVLAGDEYINSGVRGMSSAFWIGGIEADEIVGVGKSRAQCYTILH